MDKYIVLGASGGLGTDFITELLESGVGSANILGVYFSRLPIERKEFFVPALQVNLINPEQSFDKIDNWLPAENRDRIHIIHFAGITINETIKKVSKETLHKQFQTNVVGPLQIIQHLWGPMQNVKFGRIVLIGSVLAHYPVFGTLGYSMTKAALEVAARNLTIEGKKDNIFATCIASGYTDRGMIEKVPEQLQKQLTDEVIPLRKFGSTKELSKLILHVLNNDYFAGQTIHWNGGLYLG